MASNIEHEPAFAWWLPFTLQKLNIIVFKLQKKYWCKTNRFGIEVKRAYAIDEKAGTIFLEKLNAEGGGGLHRKGRYTRTNPMQGSKSI